MIKIKQAPIGINMLSNSFISSIWRDWFLSLNRTIIVNDVLDKSVKEYEIGEDIKGALSVSHFDDYDNWLSTVQVAVIDSKVTLPDIVDGYHILFGTLIRS